QAAGFHTNNFQLTLSVTNQGAAIHYTLDGSEPTESSPLFAGPILITNRTAAPNNLSLIPTVPSGYQPPAGLVFKGTVVRAKAFKTGALQSATVTRTFFIDGRARYTVPVISLATESANFFDPNIGIYVPGNAPGGNYSQRGNNWERPVHVEFFETDGALALAQDAGVKIHGNTSQNFPIKGLDLDGTGGQGRQPFRHRIFPERARAEFAHFLLRPSGQDYYLALMRDEFMQSLAAEFGMETQAARLAVVFLNGEYWGLHYLKEKEDADFVAYRRTTCATLPTTRTCRRSWKCPTTSTTRSPRFSITAGTSGTTGCGVRARPAVAGAGCSSTMTSGSAVSRPWRPPGGSTCSPTTSNRTGRGPNTR
ncbi:MAG: hypothetical protein DME21_17155, partial [Verrucomicrobia bacterium]